MSTAHILGLLIEERDRLQAAINALHDAPTPAPNNVPSWVGSPALKKKRKVSAAARKRMAEGQKRRWADIRNFEDDPADTPKKKTTKAIIAEAIAPKEDAEFKAKMSAAMKASWARRKKAAKKKAA